MLLKAIRMVNENKQKYAGAGDQIDKNSQPVTSGVNWSKHTDKEIEFYCKDCKALVCSKCMFFQHNGHQLCLLEDAIGQLTKEMDELEQYYDKNISKEYTDSQRNEQRFANLQKLLEQNKIKQIGYIRQGFEQIIDTLIKKKESLIEEVNNKYDEESKNVIIQAKQKRLDIKPSHEIRSEAQALKELPIDDKVLLTTKAQNILQFNERIVELINSTRNKFSQSAKVGQLSSLEGDKAFQIKPEFEPVTIDTTAAVSYILNLTLADQSIVSKKGSLENPNQIMEQSSKSVMSPMNKLEKMKNDNNQAAKADDDGPVKLNSHAFSIENMNIMKHRQSNRTKTVDTEKRSPSVNSNRNNNDLKFGGGESQPVRKKAKLKLENEQYRGLYCIGDLPFLLFYHWKTKVWSKIDFSEESAYKGCLKYPSVVRIQQTDCIILTGGCDNYTGEASDAAYKANITTVANFERIGSMANKRYGHCSVCLRGILYVVGGFDHQDTETTSPSTLVSCEKYTEENDTWGSMSNLIHPVAFAAVWGFDDAFLYVFGGFEDYSTVDVIQKYDAANDQWDLLSIKLPVRLAKMGAANMDDENIMIVGGIFEDANGDAPLSLISNSYKLNVRHMKWTKVAKMKNKRTLNSTLYFFDSQLYVVGSSNDGACEKYDPEVNKWISIPSYDEILAQNDLQSFSVWMYD